MNTPVRFCPRDLYVTVPEERLQQATAAAQVLGTSVYSEYPFQPGTNLLSTILKSCC